MRLRYSLILMAFLSLTTQCKKLIEIPPPASTITTSQVFSSDAQALSVLSGIYFQMINTASANFASGAMSIFSGVYADELAFFSLDDPTAVELQNDALTAGNSLVTGNYWTSPYSYIYSANAILGNIDAAPNVHDSVKAILKGEAKFIRAFCYFYLTNYFDDIPFPLTIDYNKTALLSATPQSQIYDQIVKDLIDAQSTLPTDYSLSGGRRTIPNKWAATALLSRVYLYRKDWINAETQASSLISNSNYFNLESSLKDVFLVNSREAIWQLQQDSTTFPFNATPEGNQILPLDTLSQPVVYILNNLLDSFETNDKRKENWIGHTTYLNTTYFFPYKYKMGSAISAAGGENTEFYMILRLAEQFLIRAEARAMLNKLSDATDDLNSIRFRAGLPLLQVDNKQNTLSEIIHERKVELFCEWGNRWLDLKRWNLAKTVLSPIKPSWSDKALLFPIPPYELQSDPNLRQNPGY